MVTVSSILEVHSFKKSTLGLWFFLLFAATLTNLALVTLSQLAMREIEEEWTRTSTLAPTSAER
jgi:DNA-binding IclR family transcriptional regulator